MEIFSEEADQETPSTSDGKVQLVVTIEEELLRRIEANDKSSEDITRSAFT